MTPGTRTSQSALDVLVGLAAALVVFAAVPTVLVVVVGMPVPSQMSLDAIVSLHGLFDALTVVSWGAWACCAWPILRAVARRVHSHDVSGATAAVDRVALRIAVAVLALSSLLGVAAVGASAGAAAAAPSASAAVPPPGFHLAKPRSDLAGRSIAVRGVFPPGAAEPPGSTSPPLAPAVPPLAALGTGAVLAGLLARRLRRARRRYAYARDHGQRAEDPGDREADVGALLAPFESAPVVRWVEIACRHLRLALERTGTVETAPALLWVRAGDDGVEVRFAGPIDEPGSEPGGWQRTNASTWLLPSTLEPAQLERAAAASAPWCPALLPVGDDDRGTWLVPLGAGGELVVVGPRAGSLVRAMRAGVESWSWSEQLVVTDDVATARQAANVADGSAGAQTPSLLFFGDPASLPDSVRRASATVTLVPLGSAGSTLAHSATTVIVDERAATVHPHGVSVRPHLLGEDVVRAVEATEQRYGARAPAPLTGEAGTGDAAIAIDDGNGSRPLGVRPSAAATRRLPALGSSHPVARGQAEVRLLQSVPDISGLAASIDPKRARRAVELVAYLAVHHPHPVTGDRLRTRVLGSPDVDAARKTLFNTAAAARQALGPGPAGELLFPPATRAGHYRVSPLVTVDALRCIATIEGALAWLPPLHGDGEDDGDDHDHDVAAGGGEREDPAGLLESALQLVGGEPLGGELTGFGWWRSEGHERRLADAVVDGACTLMRLSISEGQLDRARWTLERARAVEPYSEALTRAALRLAAASGDAHRLQREWNECVRQADELDPGTLPSAKTEQLFVLLRSRLAARGRRADEAILRT